MTTVTDAFGNSTAYVFDGKLTEVMDVLDSICI
ncbi:MAG: hypothetical protein K1W36_13810 [Lachnospiraceae bacterium]